MLRRLWLADTHKRITEDCLDQLKNAKGGIAVASTQ
jgi:hypothetical protein